MRIRTARDLGILIREARKRRGLSQAALAKQINTTQTWVSWIENGKPGAEIGGVLLALNALGVELHVDLPPVSGGEAGDLAGQRDRFADGPDDDVPPYTL